MVQRGGHAKEVQGERWLASILSKGGTMQREGRGFCDEMGNLGVTISA
jgi:hypothetical protein